MLYWQSFKKSEIFPELTCCLARKVMFHPLFMIHAFVNHCDVSLSATKWKNLVTCNNIDGRTQMLARVYFRRRNNSVPVVNISMQTNNIRDNYVTMRDARVHHEFYNDFVSNYLLEIHRNP